MLLINMHNLPIPLPEIDFLCMFSENMSDEEVINIIDEIEAEEEARIELADMAREGWR